MSCGPEPRRILGSARVTTDAKGMAHDTYTVPRFHYLIIGASAFDSNRREATHETSLWVAGAGCARGSEEDQRLEIYPEKRFYRPSDTAHILVVTQSPGAQLLTTIEGQRVFAWSVQASNESSLTLDIPTQERNEPNSSFAATYIKKEQLYEGSKSISVLAREKALKVTIETDKPQYRPHEKVTCTVTAQDEQGRPVSAELSLGIVDEAIYAVRPESVQPREKVFYHRHSNRVCTQFLTTYWFSGYSGLRQMELTRRGPATRLADFKSARVDQPRVRKFSPSRRFGPPPSPPTRAAGEPHPPSRIRSLLGAPPRGLASLADCAPQKSCSGMVVAAAERPNLNWIGGLA